MSLAKRLAALAAAGIAFAAVLVAAAAAPAFEEREFSDFRACVASIPHPARPATRLARDPMAQGRALALLSAEDGCAHASGFDGSGRERPLEWLRELRPGTSVRNEPQAFFLRCSQERRSARSRNLEITAAIYCYRGARGLMGTQFELSTGYLEVKPMPPPRAQRTDGPVLTKNRFPHAMAHANDGTWWDHSCW
ncbi:MAG TPA: hypothetical protein VK760_08960 [Candidatus Acidoferrales bacterium]|nr:hypothetical protein [Candidatus Acidoferrales bacterium]